MKNALIQRLETFEALARLSGNEDFGTFVAELREAERTTQDIYNEADLTKPIPTAEIKGQLKALKIILEQLDTVETKVIHLRQQMEEDRKETAKGSEVRNPISAALRPPGG